MKSFPPKTILVAFDLSERSLDAWRYARRLAGLLNARLLAVYVSPWTPAVDAMPALPLLSAAERKALLGKLRRRLRGADGLLVREGDPPREIVRQAEESRASLIVLLTHGRRGVRRFFRGSVAECVVRCSPVPVLSLHVPGRKP